MLGDDGDRLTALWRDKQLQYTWLRAVQGRHADFWQVTGDALDFALETLGLDVWHSRSADEALSDAGRLSGSAGRPGAAEGGRHAHRDPVEWLAANARCGRQGRELTGLLDAVLSVEEVGVYKPHPKVYQLAVDRLGVPADAISSCRRMPGTPAASAFGMQVVWCNRYGQRRERLPGRPTAKSGRSPNYPTSWG